MHLFIDFDSMRQIYVGVLFKTLSYGFDLTKKCMFGMNRYFLFKN